MKTLHLNLKRKWFDMIKSGEKKEEYREIKKHWITQLIGGDLNDGDCDFYHFDTVTFSNGYAKNRPQFVIELISIEFETGFEKWGAIEGVEYFVLKLGNIIQQEPTAAERKCELPSSGVEKSNIKKLSGTIGPYLNEYTWCNKCREFWHNKDKYCIECKQESCNPAGME